MRQKRGMFLVALLLFIVGFLPLVMATGCYTFEGADESLYCQVVDAQVAQTDCNEAGSECNFAQSFSEGSSCSTVTACQQVLCNVDCQTHALGWCEQLGLERANTAGAAIPQDEEERWCQPGCCIFQFTNQDNLFCGYPLNKWECDVRAQQAGVISPRFENGPSMDLAECRGPQFCALSSLGSASFAGTVKTQEGTTLSGDIIVEGKGSQTFTNGQFSVTSINPGSIQVRVQVPGYVTQTLTLTLQSGSNTHDFILLPQGEVAHLMGVVKNSQGTPIPSARILWSGPQSGEVDTGSNGGYDLSSLSSGTYHFRISAPGFNLLEQEVTLREGDTILDFTLSSVIFVGISGTVFEDRNSNRQLDPSDTLISGARLFVNGQFRSFSKYPQADFRIPLTAGRYQIEARFGQLRSEVVEVEVRSDGSTYLLGQLVSSINLFLIPSQPTCGVGNERSASSFTVNHVPGQKAVSLQWVKSCPEIVGYRLEKKEGTTLHSSASFSSSQGSFIDQSVEWGKTYTYTLVALYQNSVEKPSPAISLTLGNSQCEGQYHSPGGWETFCLRSENGGNQQKVYSCSDENQVTERSCLDQGSSYYCAPVGELTADCKDAGVCSLNTAGTDPLGIYQKAQACYGLSGSSIGRGSNFCYYDTTLSVVDQCLSCVGVESCFDYKSKDACEVNSCLTQNCLFVEGSANSQDPLLVDYSSLLSLPYPVSEETGSGYCVQENYKNVDQCWRCSSNGDLFENNLCTAQVCLALGKCFSNSPTENLPLSSCSACPQRPTAQASCYSYTTELECTGGVEGSLNTMRSSDEIFSYSSDVCNWNRCSWTGSSSYSPSACVKDGNADGVDDCSDASMTDTQRANCRLDIYSPTTTISSSSTVLSLNKTKVEFSIRDNETDLSQVRFCLALADSPATCSNSDQWHDFSFTSAGREKTIQIDLSSTLPVGVAGTPYLLYYYSSDRNKNQEQRKSTPFFIDTQAPSFALFNRSEIKGDHFDFTIGAEGLSEDASCTFDLKPIYPDADAQRAQVGFEVEEKQVQFKDLQGLVYNVTASCHDQYGNEQRLSQTFIFDLEQGISIISPALGSVLATQTILFEITTDVGASCILYDAQRNIPLASFDPVDQEAKRHKTVPLAGFIERAYVGEHKVVCEELLTGKRKEDIFNFAIDFTPPQTKVILQEANRQIEHLQGGFEEFFINAAHLSLECLNAPGSFACAKTFYCLGDNCELITSSSYKEYQASFNVTSSTTLCYYSTDTGNSRVFNPECGNIIVDGYGITLEQPTAHYVDNAVFGVSKTPLFDLIFSTKIPTVECRVDFSSNFNYANLEDFKVKKPTSDGKYIFKEFPQNLFTSYASGGEVKTLYVQCIDSNSLLSPIKPFFLEFDPSAPHILAANARPNPIFEGRTVLLHVETDDKTLCRYSDNSTGDGSSSFETMEYSFPQFKEKKLKTIHEGSFTFSLREARKEMQILVQCRNGAGDLSESQAIDFTVDYTKAGYIVSLFPKGETFSDSTIKALVETSKAARCEFKVNESYLPFQTTGNKLHETTFSTLVEKEYQIPLRCQMGDHRVEDAVRFTIDRTAPRIISIEDGNYTCGANMRVYVYTNETSIQSYSYEVYEKSTSLSLRSRNISSNSSQVTNSSRVANQTSLSTTPRFLLNGTATSQNPFEISASTLKENYQYYVRVFVVDAAGLRSSPLESNGVLVVPANYSSCKEDKAAPTITPLIEQTCTSHAVELRCTDSTACGAISFGLSSAENTCLANSTYDGRKIQINSTKWLCYKAQDVVGNTLSSKQKIIFPDDDGDGISNSCDQCLKTSAGKVVDEEGCALGEVDSKTKDSDRDGLSDSWENLYNDLDCELDPLLSDSNSDGTLDNLEDYDADGASNIEEFREGSDPCSADAIPRGKKDGDDVDKTIPTLPPSTSSGSDVLAWALFFIGLFLTLGGSGYLIYYYKSGKGTKPSIKSSPSTTLQKEEKSVSSPLTFVKEKIFNFNKDRSLQKKSKERRAVFASFSESPHLSRVDEILRKKSAPLPRLQTLADHYSSHKENIDPLLKREEKNVFEKLGAIAKKTKEKDIEDVVSTKEAQSIFTRLKELSKKRKG